MSNVVKRDIFDRDPGMGINANNFEGEITLDLTGPLGSLSGIFYSLMFELGRRGFAIFKIEESIDVSPVFKQYYDLTIQQKQALEAQVKVGLGQIATAIHDYELVSHDLRKYKEYLDYFTKIEQGKELLKSAKKKEEREKAEQMIKEGMQTLRSVFIDQVDAYTGEGISLRTITSRWPTIIVDFMRLDDKDVDQKKIAEKYGISEAEASVLATKNKLFIEWRDVLFKPTLIQRYQHILRLAEARKTSIREYTEMLKPVIARYKIINDALSSAGGRIGAWRGFFQPASQAFSMDRTRIWAFLPFGPVEKYKVTRDYLDEIPAKQAGFSKIEIDQIREFLNREKESRTLSYYEELFTRGLVAALPVEPSIDDIVREYTPQVEKFYGVRITPIDLFAARQRLVNLFLRKAMETRGGVAYRRISDYIAPGVTWQFSPYYVFLDIPWPRTVIKLPNGSEMEDVMIENMTVQGRTQNVIIVCLLEVLAREKQLENYISQLVGEIGGSELMPIEELAKEQYPEIFGKPSPKLITGGDIKKGIKKFKWFLGDLFESLGRNWGIHFDWLRARGPYEFAMDDRIAELFQLETMMQGYLFVVRYLQNKGGVPGIRV
ncbi:MAG: hypothetical protein QW818_03405 [Candidatus Aenigmatarchaeota archaeon]|nr:hypothetical protein [Candidatus Aenigmarchaeota archaeon]